jgi:uncharacterized protein YrzB (UPF0473 family)
MGGGGGGVQSPVDALTQEEWEVVEEVCRVLLML